MEDKKLTLFQKLLEIQRQVMGLGKDKKSFSYEYVTGTKVLEHIKPLMNSYGLLLKQEVTSIENNRQDYTSKQGAKSEIHSKVMMRFTWIDCETGEKDVNEFGANGQNDWEKGLGSSLTYAERYFLLKYFHISTDEDDIDNPDRKPEAQNKAAAASKPEVKGVTTANVNLIATDVQKDKIRELVEHDVITSSEHEGATSLINDTLTFDKASNIIARLNRLIIERKDKQTTAA